MRHYFGYTINGQLRSVETYGPAGWPAEKCMEDPDCLEAAVTSLRKSRAKNAPDVINWVLYDCPCDPGQGAILRDCVCFNAKFSENYVDTVSKAMVPKPMQTILVDDVVIVSGDVITRDPGTILTFKVVSVGMLDGAKVTCNQKGSIDITLDDEWELTFSGGETETTNLTAPAQGSKGYVSISGLRMRPLSFCVRGFATSA